LGVTLPGGALQALADDGKACSLHCHALALNLVPYVPGDERRRREEEERRKRPGREILARRGRRRIRSDTTREGKEKRR
jgi:hypothetical protein